MARRKMTQSEFIQKVNERHENKYEILSQYTGAENKIRVKHECGFIWDISAGDLLRKRGIKKCPQCSNCYKRSNDEFLAEVYRLVGNEYVVLGEFKGVHSKIKMKHTLCNHIWDVRVTSFIHSGTRCPECNGGKNDKTHEDFIKQIEEIHGNKYTVKSNYNGARNKIIFNCESHGELTTTATLLIKFGCRECCLESRLKSNDKFVSELKEVHKDNITAIEPYKKNREKIRFKCRLEHTWRARAGQVLRGSGCPVCRNSKGENAIVEYLKSKNLRYTPQQSYEGCKGLVLLRFDFCIEDVILIEFDGKQHYTPVDFGGKGMDWAINDFEKRKSHDEIKNDFCKENNIPLIRIPYWETKIEYILDSLLTHLGLVNNSEIDDNLIHRYLVNHPEWSHEKYFEQAI